MTSKSVLYILQQPPYLDARVFEAFDALLVAAAFEQRVSLLFRGPGVTQLLKDQAPSGQRNLAKILLSLETYEVNEIYAETRDFERYGLHRGDCVLEPTLVHGAEVAKLISAQDIVLSD